MPMSSISKKGLTTVPTKVREELGIKSGDKLEWKVVEKGDRTLIEVEAQRNPYELLKGKRRDSKATFERVENLADALLEKEARVGAGR